MRSGAGDPFDDEGADKPGPHPLVLAAWAGVAAIAMLAAVIAVTVGGPPQQPAPVLVAAPAPARPAAPAPAVAASPAPNRVADRFRDPLDPGGRSDFVQAENGGAAEDLAAELARMKVENSALRQTGDVLRNQIAILSDRLDQVESRLGEYTGSLGAAPAPRATLPAPVPTVPVTRSDAADTRRAEVGSPRTEFGIELGAFEDLTAVRTAWRKLLTDHPDLFGDLDALATVRDRAGATELLLVAGPFPNAADAATRCTKVEDAGMTCLPAFFLGQALAIR